MKALVVYESFGGNTKAVAEAISEGLARHHLDTEVVGVDIAPPLQKIRVDLLVAGAPTHAFGLSGEDTSGDAHRHEGDLLPSGMRGWLDSGPASLLAATFDTHVRHPNLPGHAGHQAAKKLRRLGCRILAKPESFDVDSQDGPLLAGELDRARSWGDTLARRLMKDSTDH